MGDDSLLSAQLQAAREAAAPLIARRCYRCHGSLIRGCRCDKQVCTCDAGEPCTDCDGTGSRYPELAKALG